MLNHRSILRVAGRYLASTDASGLLKSLLGIAKKGGAFASPAQAKLLWNACKTMRTPDAAHWGRQYEDGDPNAYTASFVLVDERFGKTDPSKIRYYAYYIVVDGAGVKAVAKCKVEHPKNGDTQPTISGVEPASFVRHGDFPVLYDDVSVERAYQEKIRANQPMIDKILGIPGYQDNEFLQSLITQLQTGKSLSPGQLGALRKWLDVNVGDTAEWARAYKHGMQVIEDRFIEPTLKFFHTQPGVDKASQEWYYNRVKSAWETFKRKPEINPELGDFGTLQNLSQRVGIPHVYGTTGFGDAMARLWIASQKGQKAPKNALKLVPVALRVIEQFEKLSPSKVEAALAKDFGGAPAVDPFKEFT